MNRETRLIQPPDGDNEYWKTGYFLSKDELKQMIIDFGETYEPVPVEYLDRFLKDWLKNNE